VGSDFNSFLFLASDVFAECRIATFHFYVRPGYTLLLYSFPPEVVHMNDMNIPGLCLRNFADDLKLTFGFRGVVDYLEREPLVNQYVSKNQLSWK